MMNRKLALLVAITTLTLLFVLSKEPMRRKLVKVMNFKLQSPEKSKLHQKSPSEKKSPNSEKSKLHTAAPMETITPIPGTRHLMASAFKDHRLDGAIRIISIICTKELQPLHCVLCTNSEANANYEATANPEDDDQCTITQAEIKVHSEWFGFTFVTSDVFCRGHTQATHVSITTKPNTTHHNMTFLVIQNQDIKEPFKYNFTVCLSTLFGKYNNALQYVQTLEVYKLIGVQRVVIYNTSCGPDVEKVLQHYRKEGLVEVVSWPIDKFLTPSTGWLYKTYSGDMHYYGQLTTLNECIYRYMYQSKYLLLNDIDEIIMPYKYPNLEKMMEALQRQHPTAGVFRIESHFFPKIQFEGSSRYRLARWSRVPGVNILERIYRAPINRAVYNPKKLVIDPRKVEQTSVHETLIQSGPVINVPYDICLMIHIQFNNKANFSKDSLVLDKKLWEFEEQLIPSVDDVLNQSLL